MRRRESGQSHPSTRPAPSTPAHTKRMTRRPSLVQAMKAVWPAPRPDEDGQAPASGRIGRKRRARRTRRGGKRIARALRNYAQYGGTPSPYVLGRAPPPPPQAGGDDDDEDDVVVINLDEDQWE